MRDPERQSPRANPTPDIRILGAVSRRDFMHLGAGFVVLTSIGACSRPVGPPDDRRELRVLRPEDLLSLHFELRNLRIESGGWGPARLVRIDDARDALLLVTVPRPAHCRASIPQRHVGPARRYRTAGPNRGSRSRPDWYFGCPLMSTSSSSHSSRCSHGISWNNGRRTLMPTARARCRVPTDRGSSCLSVSRWRPIHWRAGPMPPAGREQRPHRAVAHATCVRETRQPLDGRHPRCRICARGRFRDGVVRRRSLVPGREERPSENPDPVADGRLARSYAGAGNPKPRPTYLAGNTRQRRVRTNVSSSSAAKGSCIRSAIARPC